MGEAKKYGYARVSTKEQNLQRQTEALLPYLDYDERSIITDKQSGKDFDRQGYLMLRDRLLRSGDTLYIKELDRLGRNYEQIKEEYYNLIQKGISIEILDTPMLSTTNKSSLELKLISSITFELLSYLAEKERVKIKERCAEGIAAARASGVRFGRAPIERPSNFQEVYNEWKDGQITAVEAMKKTNLKKNTFYKMAHEHEKEQNKS
jgi:DNA invertase Pin-like site-specific DNA recombinase